MDYKELWNQLKAQMLNATKLMHEDGSDIDDYLFRADAILNRMATLEVKQFNDMKAKEQELDLRFAEMLFGKKGE